MKAKNLLMTTIAIFGLALFTNAQVPNYIPTNGLVGWWPFNGNANDESGNGNDGAVNGPNSINDRFGIPNSSYSFDGINDKIEILSPENIPIGNSNYTFSTWINNTGNNNGSIIWYGNTSNNEANGLRLSQDGCTNNSLGTFGFQNYWWNNDAYYCTDDENNLSQNTWTNIVITYNGVSRKIFLNGMLKNTTQNTAPMNVLPVAEVLFGWVPYYNYYGFKGYIDDTGIWNRALTEEEITTLYFGSALGINEVSQSNLFSVFPNPAQSEINVNIDSKLVGSVFTIYDNSGKVVKSGKLNSANTTIELNDLSGGIYTFNLGENRKQTFKVIKE